MKNIQLTTEEVMKIAKLAQLKLSDDEVTKFQGQLSEVLNYVEILNELDTEQIEPTSQVTGLKNVTRVDEIKSSLGIDEILSSVAKTKKEMFETQAVFQNKNEA